MSVLTTSEMESNINNFQGLDMDKILTSILQKLTSGTRQMDLLMLITVGLNRGNMASKIARTMGRGKAAKFKNACSYFGIRDSIRSAPNRSDALTLRRLRLALPLYAAHSLNVYNVARPVPTDALNTQYGNETHTFPIVLRDMCIASLLPINSFGCWNEERINNALFCIFGYCIMESAVIGDKTERQTQREKCIALRRFMKKTFTSAHVPKFRREAFASSMSTELSEARLASIADAVRNHIRSFGDIDGSITKSFLNGPTAIEPSTSA